MAQWQKPLALKRPRVEMVPLIDMFFLLLVFFIYGVFSMSVQEGLQLDLPSADTAVPTHEDRAITISLTAGGELFVNRAPVSLEALASTLRRMPQTQEHDPLVLINAHRDASHGVVVAILDQVRQAGVQRVSVQATSTAPR